MTIEELRKRYAEVQGIAEAEPLLFEIHDMPDELWIGHSKELEAMCNDLADYSDLPTKERP